MTDGHKCHPFKPNLKNSKIVIYNPHANFKQNSGSNKDQQVEKLTLNQLKEKESKNEDERDETFETYVGCIIVEEDTNEYSYGSGTLLEIADQTVLLTCAHVFCRITHGAKTDIKKADCAVFQLDDGTQVGIEKIFIYPKYECQDGLYDGYDFAIALLDQNDLHGKKYSRLKWSNDFKSGGEVYVVGYPAEYLETSHLQYGKKGVAKIESTNTTHNELITYSNKTIKTTEGQSGCPVVDCSNSSYVVGVHVGFDPTTKGNVATKLSEDLLAWTLSCLKVDPEEAKKAFKVNIEPTRPPTQIDINQSGLAKIAAYALTGAKKYPVNLFEFVQFDKNILKKAASSVGVENWNEIKKTIELYSENPSFSDYLCAHLGGLLLKFTPKEISITKLKIEEAVLNKKAMLDKYLINYSTKTTSNTENLEKLKSDVSFLITNRKINDFASYFYAGYLYYTLDRMILQDKFMEYAKGLISGTKTKKMVKNEVELTLSRFSKDHQEVKKVLSELIEKKIGLSNNYIYVEGHDGTKFELYDWSSKIKKSSLSSSIIDELYRCHITDKNLNYLYHENTWSNFWINCHTKSFEMQANPVYLEKTVGYTESDKDYHSLYNPEEYIWKFGFTGKQPMIYFMDSYGSGSHTNNYKDPKNSEIIDFRSARYLFYAMRGGYPSLVILNNRLNENYFQLDTLNEKDLLQNSNKFNWVLEINADEMVSSVAYNYYNSLKLSIIKSADNFKEFTGYIRNPNKPNMYLYFGSYSSFNPVKYYTFQNSNDENERSHLNFTCVKQRGSKNSKIGSYDTFSCKISTFYNQTMFMARNDRDTSSSYMGNNESGGELVVIELKERTAPNCFRAKITISGGYKLFINEKGDLMWTSGSTNGKDSDFEVQIEGDEYSGKDI